MRQKSVKTRRDLLRISVGPAAALNLRPASIARALAIPAGSIMDVQHVVILMEENRSFDHDFGSLLGVQGVTIAFLSQPETSIVPSRHVQHQRAGGF